MKKKALAFCLLGAMALGTCPASAEDGTREISATFRNIKIIVDGKQLSTTAEPFLYNGTTYLPVRAVGEAVGKEVAWDSNTNTITLTTPPPAIETNSDIIGNLDFELTVTPSGKKERTEILRVNEKREKGSQSYSLYYYGLSDVSVTIDGQTLPLAQALQEGKLSPSDIRKKGWQDVENKEIWGDSYRDGGSVCFMYDGFTIIKFNTLEGLRDFYIGIPEMELNALEEQYYPYSWLPSVDFAIERYVELVINPKQTAEYKKECFDEGFTVIKKVAERDHLTDSALQAAIQKYQEACGMDLE